MDVCGRCGRQVFRCCEPLTVRYTPDGVRYETCYECDMEIEAEKKQAQEKLRNGEEG